MSRTHYISDGKVLCSHSEDGSDTSGSILDVTCGHCWNKYDKIDERKPNVPEMREYAEKLEWELEKAAVWYFSEGKIQFTTGFAICFCEGPDSVPEDMAGVYQDEDSPFEKRQWEALKSSVRITQMTVGRNSDINPRGVWAKKYQEDADRVVRAVQPVLVEREEAEAARLTSELRNAVMRREEDECDICGATLSNDDSGTGKTATVDHIFPRVLGGPTEEWNLRLLCQSCNSFKHVLLDPTGIKKAADRLEECLMGQE